VKEIKAIIQPFMLEHVCAALESIDGLPGITVSQVIGYGKQRATNAKRKVKEAGRSFVKKTKVEVVVNDALAPVVVEAIAAAARTGKPGDGKVFVYEVADVVKIRTGERGQQAI
jgi:nitrogen regulatory protein P-II 1